MTSLPNLDHLTPEQLRALAAQLIQRVETMGKKINRDQTVIEKLTHEIAQLKRLKFAKRSEQMNPEQASFLTCGLHSFESAMVTCFCVQA